MKPLDGMTAILSSPTYGDLNPVCARSLRVAMVSAISQGLKWVGDTSPDKQQFSFARNSVAAYLWNQPDLADGIMWVDSDIKVPADMIARLLMTVREHSLEFVTGIYHSRKPYYLPVIYSKIGGDRYLQCLDYPKNTTMPVDACGFGFVWTSSKTIRAIGEWEGFTSWGGWFPDTRDMPGGHGEDIAFCKQAEAAGIRLYMDSGVQVGHMPDAKAITEADFRAQGITLEDPRIQDRQPIPTWGNAKSQAGIIDEKG